MKKLVLFTSLVLIALASCKKNGPIVKVKSVSFSSKNYEMLDIDEYLCMRENLVITPNGILDTCKIAWESSDRYVAGINIDGCLEPRSAGQTMVFANVQGKYASCKVTVLETQVESISLEDMSVELIDYMSIRYTTVPSGIPKRRISFSSSNSNIAYVSPNSGDVVVGVGVGTATITAKVDDKVATCKVTVWKKDVQSITISPKAYLFTSVGETMQLTAKIEPEDATYRTASWSSSDKNIATVKGGLVTCTGRGSAVITAEVDGKRAECIVTMPEYGTVTDSQNNTYKTVNIGNLWWMAENMRATKYSPNNIVSKNIDIAVLTPGSSCPYTPYCIDAGKKTNWVSEEDWDTSYDDLVSKFGYLYNWAAAVGVADGRNAKTDFGTSRQGICPDGWHLPSAAEWDKLRDFVEDCKGEASTAGKYLKSVNGWYNRESSYKPSLDSFGFTVLPAGKCKTGKVGNVGLDGVFWTSTPNVDYPESFAQFKLFSWVNDYISSTATLYGSKEEAYSVRCVKK